MNLTSALFLAKFTFFTELSVTMILWEVQETKLNFLGKTVIRKSYSCIKLLRKQLFLHISVINLVKLEQKALEKFILVNLQRFGRCSDYLTVFAFLPFMILILHDNWAARITQCWTICENMSKRASPVICFNCQNKL